MRAIEVVAAKQNLQRKDCSYNKNKSSSYTDPNTEPNGPGVPQYQPRASTTKVPNTAQTATNQIQNMPEKHPNRQQKPKHLRQALTGRNQPPNATETNKF